MTYERSMELLSEIVNYISIANDTSNTIEKLLKMGFTSEELVNVFAFSKEDVNDVLNNEEEEKDE